MPRAAVKLENPLGMHLRLAFALAQRCADYECSVKVACGPSWADGKEITSLLSLGVEPGAALTLETDGPGADTALNELLNFFATSAKTL